MDKRAQLFKRLRAVLAILLVALYAAGLVLMLLKQTQLAIILWVVSTLGGIALLYWLKVQRERQEAAQPNADAPKEP